eukprot:GSA120T00018484001.1
MTVSARTPKAKSILSRSARETSLDRSREPPQPGKSWRPLRRSPERKSPERRLQVRDTSTSSSRRQLLSQQDKEKQKAPPGSTTAMKGSGKSTTTRLTAGSSSSSSTPSNRPGTAGAPNRATPLFYTDDPPMGSAGPSNTAGQMPATKQTLGLGKKQVVISSKDAEFDDDTNQPFRRGDLGVGGAGRSAPGPRKTNFVDADDAGLGEGPESATDGNIKSSSAASGPSPKVGLGSSNSKPNASVQIRSVEAKRIQVTAGPSQRFVEPPEESPREPLIIRRAKATKPLAERLGVAGKVKERDVLPDSSAAQPQAVANTTATPNFVAAPTKLGASTSADPAAGATSAIPIDSTSVSSASKTTDADQTRARSSSPSKNDVQGVSERLEARGLRVRERFNQTQPLLTSLKGEISAILNERKNLLYGSSGLRATTSPSAASAGVAK